MHSAVNGHPEFIFDDAFVADENILGEIGQGFDLTKEWFTELTLHDRRADRRCRRARVETGPGLGRAARAVRCADPRRSS